MAKWIKKSFIVLNRQGLHVRPSMELAVYAQRFKSQIHLSYRGMYVDAKKAYDILGLSAHCGVEVGVEAEGIDAQKAVDGILALAQKSFNAIY